MTDLIALHKKVWEFRDAAIGIWPTPEPIDALRFAVTEMGEVMDCYLRQDEKWVRNNSRNRSLNEELADLALMLLTTIPAPYGNVLNQKTRKLEIDSVSIDELTVEIYLAFYLRLKNDWVSTVAIIHALLIIGALMDIEHELDACLNRLAAKHGIPWKSTA